MAVDFVTSIAIKIGEYLVAPIGRRIGYVLFYNSNVGDFKNQVKELENKRVEVQGRAAESERNGDAILPSVNSWLVKVEKIKQESSELDGEFQVTKRCFNVPYPSLQSRYQGSKKAKKNTAVARELEQSGNFERVSLSTHPSATRFKSTEVAENFESRRLTFKEIKEAIEDGQISMIGIYGIGGVGKTVLVKEVVKQAQDGFQFEEVVMAVVSQPVNLERIQQQIAEMLGVKFEKESELGRAERLNARLKQKKKVLVILDDIWEPVNLGAIGIPFGAKHEGCKIVLTSRREDVCNQMGSQRNIQVGVLLKQEAWDLFQKMAGDCVHAPRINPSASKIVKRCSGLPLAIVTVARALKDKPLSIWKDAANRRLVNKEVFSALQLSYDYLEIEEAKLIFLLCCIYGEDHNIAIEDLWRYGFSLSLFQEVDTEEAARDRAFALAEILKYSCLLQEGMDGNYVKMHDVVRDFAISVASKDEYGFLVRSGPGFTNFPESIEFQRYTRMSIISDAIHIFPDRLECPNLQFLYLECSHPWLKVPDDFFSGMKLLKVLVMSRMHFLSLPPSLVALGNLETLCLDNCSLKDVSIIGTLKELKFLSFIGSDLEELPKEIGELIHLKLLDLSQCEQLEIFPHDVLLRLSQLEGLYMGASSDRYGFGGWEVERRDKERRNVSLRDLKHMSRLTSIHIFVPNEDCLPDDGDSLFNNFLRFQICIGTFYANQGHFLYSRALTLESLRIPLKLLSISLKTAEYLHLEEIRGLENILYELDREGVLYLKCLTVKETRKVEYIFNAKASVSPATSSSLVELNLSRLPDLKAIYHGHLPSEFFVKLQELMLSELPALINIWNEPATACLRSLRVLIVEKCNGLKNLFPHFTAEDLSELVELRVESCKIMEVIFQKEVEEAAATMNDIEFPHLQILELKSLPNLINFYSKMKCSDTDTKEPLFSKKLAFPTLEKLIMSEVGDVEEIWHHQIPDKSFFQLKTLQVDSCHQLQNVVPFHMLTRLHNLEQLSIQNCDSVKEVVELEGFVVDQGEVNGRLSQLRELRLQKLPEIKHIMWWDMYPHATLSFKNLGSIHIFACNCLKSIFPPSIASSLVQLRRVEIVSCETVKAIISNEGGGKENFFEIVVFPRLHTLILKALPSLDCFYQIPCRAKEANNLHDLRQPLPLFDEKVEFPVLEKLVIREANNLKEIWHPQVEFKSFSQVKVLELKSCHKVLNAIPFNMLRRLQSVEELYVEDCASVEKVVEHEGLAVLESVNGTLPQLRILKLRLLPKLKSVFPPSIACSLVQLQEVKISSCKMMETIIVKEKEQKGNCIETIVFGELHTFELKDLPSLESLMGSPNKEGNLDHDLIQPLFDKKVIFPVLKILVIHGVHNLKEMWHPQIPANSFSQLKFLSVQSCHQMLNVVPFHVLRMAQSLEEITVQDCDSMEEIVVEPEGLVAAERHVNGFLFTQLRILRLWKLPRLKHIMYWDKYPLGTLGFQRVSSVTIRECNSLKSLFPPSIANSLVQLKYIYIDSCDLLETIIAKEREGEENFLGIIMFPKLNRLTLNKLPNFMSFHTELNWSSLEELQIMGCPAMKTFISSTPCPQKLKTGVDGLKEAPKKGNLCSSQRPFFDNKVALTSLTYLWIADLDSTQQIFDNQHPDEFLSQLLWLRVVNCDKLLRVIPSYLLPRLRNLYTLTISKCKSVEEILEGGVGEKQATVISFTKLKQLELNDLPNLRIFCSGNYTLNCSSLDSVKMENCPKMQTFSSELISAPELERVEVEDGEYLWEGDLNTTIKRIFHEKNMLGVGSVSDDSSHKLDSKKGNDIFNGGLVMENLQFPIQGRISSEKKDAEESETLSHLYSHESTSITVSATKENIVTNIDQEYDMLAIGDFSGSEPPRKLASKEEVFSNEGKGKAVAVVEGIYERLPSSSRTPISSHQPCSISGVSIMEDTRTLLDAGVFPKDIASGALDRQNVRRNMDKNIPGVGSVSDEPSNKLDSEQGNDVFDEVDIGGSCEGQHIDMGQNVLGVGDANGDELAIQGRISSEKKDAEESETLSHLYSHESTSIIVSTTKENIVMNIDQEHDMLAKGDFSSSEPPRKLASKEEVISKEGKGKAVAAVQGIDERLPSSSRTPVSSHQPCSISGVSIMEDTQTLLDAGVFPEDIASGALDRQNVRRNMDKLCPDQMVVSRDEFESLQRDRDLLRRRVETLEDFLVSGYRGSRHPGLSMTLDVGWAAWSFLLIFSLLFFLFFSFWLFVL